MSSAIDRDALRRQIIDERGYWHPFHEALLELDPAFLKAYLDFISAPWKSKHLAPKVREFIYIAVDGSVTHLYDKGLRRHIEHALKAGATREEVLQVIELTCLTMHNTHELGIPILVEELKRTSPAIEAEIADLTPEEKRRKDEFVASVGYWPRSGDALLKIAPLFIDGFLRFRSVAGNSGPLEPKIKEFVGLAINAAPTCLYAPGVRAHIQRALAHGATKEEISEVLQLASAISIHTATFAVPGLVDAINSLGTDS